MVVPEGMYRVVDIWWLRLECTCGDSRGRDRVGMFDPVRRSALAGRSLGVLL